MTEKPPSTSFDSTNGPSVTIFFRPRTTRPGRSRGTPRFLSWPLSAISFIHACHLAYDCCARSPVIAASRASGVARYNNTYSLMVGLRQGWFGVLQPGVVREREQFDKLRFLPTDQMLAGSSNPLLVRSGSRP